MIPNRGGSQRSCRFLLNVAAGLDTASIDFDIFEIVAADGNRKPDFSSEGGLLFPALTGYISASRRKAVSRFAGTSVL